MMVRRALSAILAVVLMLEAAPALAAFAVPAAPYVTVNPVSAIDGFSVRLPRDRASFRYQYFLHGAWSAWQRYESDGDVGPGEESELLMVPEGTTSLRVDGIASASDVHVISVSKDPVKYRVAASGDVPVPGILSRTDWGADDAYMFPQKAVTDTQAATDTAKGDTSAPLTQSDSRIKDCQDAQRNYPTEFKTASTVTTDAQGRRLSWALQYSKEIKLLVVHHEALMVTGDPRPAVERVRALYKYHALNRGWSDIGYNYVVDENGQIYEGRYGGKYVVGGHAYCNNVGTIGIVMLGNFELEMPTQAQAKGLQKLLDSLAKAYNINPKQAVQYHGKTFSAPIVGHRDLLSTLCPGYSLYGALPQIVVHVQQGDLDASVKFSLPVGTLNSSAPKTQSFISSSGLAEGISFIGRTSIAINPGGKQRLSFSYTTGQAGAYEGKKVGDVVLSQPGIVLWQDDGIHQTSITKGILLDTDLPAGETESIQLIVQAPVDAGTYWMDIAGLHFMLSVYGRRARTGEFINPFAGNAANIVHRSEPKRETAIVTRVRPETRPSTRSSSSSSARSVSAPSASAVTAPVTSASQIRIRLSTSASPIVTFTDAGSVNGSSVSRGTAVSLFARGSQCVATVGGSPLAADSVLRLQSSNGNPLTIDSVRSKVGAYKGVIECRVDGGGLTLIDELPMEDYLAGLGEEPDTEPYEKQRAFAIAARTYASFYLQNDQRKFPGKPYDGSDDPATFQSYFGVNFTADNPSWARAALSTAGEVLMSGNVIIKPPYFSSDDGRTRSPAEAGWNNFPNANLFLSKPDPWCTGLTLRGHGVGMSGCGALGQAKEGRSAEQILQYYYPGVRITSL